YFVARHGQLISRPHELLESTARKLELPLCALHSQIRFLGLGVRRTGTPLRSVGLFRSRGELLFELGALPFTLLRVRRSSLEIRCRALCLLPSNAELALRLTHRTLRRCR